MAQNDFLPFAIASGANVLPQEDYSNLPALSTGFTSGLASSMQINKAIRQGTVMASVLAQFIAETTGSDVLDNGDTVTLVTALNHAINNIASMHIAIASGSADEIAATFSPPIVLSNGMVVYVRATAANATTTPTFNPDNLGALPIVKGANLALSAGDIAGAGYWMILQYDQAFNKWVLQNPAKGITPQSGAPIGSGLIHYGSTAPQHYLVCDGSAISRTAYPELFTAIGTIYGEGDGSTTFNLPNMLDRFPQGKNTGFQGIYIDPGLPNTTGSIYGAADISAADGVFSTFVPPAHTRISSGTLVSSGVGASFDPSRSNPIYGASNTVQPAALTILPCIKYE